MGCSKPGKYIIALNSDDKAFGGWGNVDSSAQMFSEPQQHDGRPHSFNVYGASQLRRRFFSHAPVRFSSAQPEHAHSHGARSCG